MLLLQNVITIKNIEVVYIAYYPYDTKMLSPDVYFFFLKDIFFFLNCAMCVWGLLPACECRNC